MSEQTPQPFLLPPLITGTVRVVSRVAVRDPGCRVEITHTAVHCCYSPSSSSFLISLSVDFPSSRVYPLSRYGSPRLGFSADPDIRIFWEGCAPGVRRTRFRPNRRRRCRFLGLATHTSPGEHFAPRLPEGFRCYVVGVRIWVSVRVRFRVIRNHISRESSMPTNC